MRRWALILCGGFCTFLMSSFLMGSFLIGASAGLANGIKPPDEIKLKRIDKDAPINIHVSEYRNGLPNASYKFKACVISCDQTGKHRATIKFYSVPTISPSLTSNNFNCTNLGTTEQLLWNSGSPTTDEPQSENKPFPGSLAGCSGQTLIKCTKKYLKIHTPNILVACLHLSKSTKDSGTWYAILR